MWCHLGSYLCKNAGDHSVTTDACSSLHLTCRGLCGMEVWKLNGVICTMYNKKTLEISRIFHWKSCRTDLAEPGIMNILSMDIHWALSLLLFLNNCNRTHGIKLGWTGLLGLISVFSIHVCHTVCVFGPNLLLQMTFGLGCQLRSACRASKATTSQWSNLRAPFNNNVPLFQARRNNDQSGSQATLHMRVPITTTILGDENITFLTEILLMIWLSFYWKEIRVPTHDALTK